MVYVFTNVYLYRLQFPTMPLTALHDPATRYCSIQKKVFAAQGWARHVQSCERRQVAHHLDRQHTQMIRKRFKAAGQSSLASPLETAIGQSSEQME
jgi:hypothetical protein